MSSQHGRQNRAAYQKLYPDRCLEVFLSTTLCQETDLSKFENHLISETFKIKCFLKRFAVTHKHEIFLKTLTLLQSFGIFREIGHIVIFLCLSGKCLNLEITFEIPTLWTLSSSCKEYCAYYI